MGGQETSSKLRRLVLLFALLLIAPSMARGQDATGWWGGDQGLEEETALPPLDLNGCWVGTEQDQLGQGSLFIDFVQKGHRITLLTTARIEFSNGEVAAGHIRGHVGPSKFKVGFHGKYKKQKCHIKFHGDLSDGDLVGGYHFYCPGTGVPGHFFGTFDLARSATGCEL
jgi:hypothetical protein